MLFSEKLEFLCNITNTSNKRLSTVLSVDPSLISRIKSGKRKLSQNSNYLVSMGTYFAQKCTSDYQRNALSETMGQSKIKLIMKKELLADIIFQWLTDSSPSSFENMQRIINARYTRDDSSIVPYRVENIDFGEKINCYTYYGNSGKRLALHNLALYLLKYGTPCTIFIASDESFEWLMESSAFIDLYQKDLYRLTEQGFTFKRIAQKYYDIEEAIAAFTRWLPIYMQGKCETYYYPRIRDNVFHRTLFVAPGQIAICSNSVGYHVDSNVTYLYTDPCVANSLASEFHDLFVKCIRLAVSYTHSNTNKPILDCLFQYLEIPGNMVTKFYGLPALITPASVLNKIFGNDKEHIETLSLLAQKCHNRLSEDKLTDIITLDSPDDIRDGKVLCTVSRLVPNVPPHFYSVREYIEHLQAVLLVMNEYPDYNVILYEDISDTRSTICTIEAGKCYIIRINEPVTLFEISDQNMVASAREYILSLVKVRKGSLSIQRVKTIERIETLIATLENMEIPELE